jgi:signal transduction histidine kinase
MRKPVGGRLARHLVRTGETPVPPILHNFSEQTPPPNTFLDLRRSLHDLAQPLGALTEMVDLLLQELPEEDPVTQELRLMSEKLETVLHIFGEIRGLARETSGPQVQIRC